MERQASPVTPTKARKRINRKQSWKRNIAKQQRYAPSEPPNFPICNHNTKSYRCSILKMADIAEFHRNFYASRDKQIQDSFLIRHCKAMFCKRRRPKNETHAPKVATVKCFVRGRDGTLLPVCQATFLNILHIKRHRLQHVIKNYAITGQSPRERRGGDRISYKFRNRKESVISFIKKFKCVEAHYMRSSTNIRRYLPSELNIRKMGRMYNNEIEDNLKVKDFFFRNIFNKCFNLGFGTPRTDVCSTCLSLGEQIKINTDPDAKNKILIEKRVHTLRANSFYSLLRETRNDLLTINFDCQKNQILPKVPDQNAYYSRQLYIYNLCFVQGSSKDKQTTEKTFMYTWTENEFHKGSSEVSSALFHRLTQTNLKGCKTLRLVCDGCGGQNKNCIIVATCARWFLDAPKDVSSIELIYPVTGHSFLPSDRVFGRIEQVLKRKEVITSPETYNEVFTQFGTVFRMGRDFEAANWKEEAYRVFKGTASWHFKFSVIKRIILTRAKNRINVLVRGEPHYRSDIGQPKSVCKTGKNVKMINPDIIEMGVEVNALKLRDVNKLLIKHYGDQWQKLETLQFFIDILKKNNRPGNINENERDEADDDVIEGEIDACGEIPNLIV